MGLSTALGKLLLPVCIVVAVFSIFRVANENGLFDLIGEAPKHAYPTLVDNSIELRTVWSGIKPLYDFFIGAIVFFSTMFDPANASMILGTVHFYGFLLSTWMLVLVEAYRVGNAWRLFAFAAIWGFLMENVAMALIAPIWCLLHLVTSPTAKSGPLTPEKRTRLLVHPAELTILPWAVLIGAGVPSIAMLFTSPEPTTPVYNSRQFWLIVRQFHPFITALAQPILSMIFRPGSSTPKTSGQRDIAVARGLRGIYRIATYLSMVPHVAMLSLMGFAVLAPSVFSEEFVSAFHPLRVYSFFPFWAQTAAKVSSVADGAKMFIVWDETIASASFLIWAWALNRDALPLQGPAVSNRGSSFLGAVLKTAGIAIIGGPGAAAVALIQERDEVVLESPANPVGTSIPGIEEAGKRSRSS